MMIDSLKKLSLKNMSNVSSTSIKDQNVININFNNFSEVVTNLMSKGRIIGVFGGSITVKCVISIIKYLESNISPSELLPLQYTLTDNELSSHSIIKSKNPNNNERAIGYGIYLGNMREVGSEWTEKKPMTMMLEMFIGEKFSASVRTEKQVGYVAICNTINVNEDNNPDIHLVFTVQSTRDDAFDIVKDYVENSVLQEVESISDDEFESMKQSTITRLSQKPDNIYEDCNEIFTALTNTYDTQLLFNSDDDSFMTERINRKKMMVNSLHNMKLNDFVEFVKFVYKKGIYATILIEPMN